MNLFLFCLWIVVAGSYAYLWWENPRRWGRLLIIIGALMLAISRLHKLLE